MPRMIAPTAFAVLLAVPALADTTPDALDRYVGHYQLSYTAVLDVARETEGRLEVKRNGRPLFPIYPVGDGTFMARLIPAKLHFVTGADGTVSELLVDQGGTVTHAKPIDDAEARTVQKRANSAGVFRGGIAPGPLGSLGSIN